MEVLWSSALLFNDGFPNLYRTVVERGVFDELSAGRPHGGEKVVSRGPQRLQGRRVGGHHRSRIHPEITTCSQGMLSSCSMALTIV